MNYDLNNKTLVVKKKHVLVQYQFDECEPKIILCFRDEKGETFEEMTVILTTIDNITIEVNNL